MFKTLRRVTRVVKQRRACHAAFSEPETKGTVLTNGIRVATEETNSPLACISLFVEAGPRFETAANNGITHFIEHLAFKGFNTMSRCAVEEAVLYCGGRITAKTTQEVQSFTAICPVEAAPSITTILCKILSDLQLSCCEVEAERYNICMELEDVDRDPRALVFENLHQAAFQGTSLAQRVIGPSKNIEKFDGCFVSQFLCEHYQPTRLVVAASGYLCHDHMLSYVNNGLGHMVQMPSCEDYGLARFSGSSILYRNDSLPFLHVAIAFEAPSITHPEYLMMLVCKNAVGAWDKSQGHGNQNWPDLALASALGHLCESYESFYLPYRDVGLWGIYFVCNAMQVEDMLHNVQNIWLHLCTTTLFNDLVRARNATKLELSRRYSGSINSCLDIGEQMMYRCSRRSYATVADLVDSLNYIELQKTATKYLFDRDMVVSAVGPTEGIPEYTRIRAGQYWLRI